MTDACDLCGDRQGSADPTLSTSPSIYVRDTQQGTHKVAEAGAVVVDEGEGEDHLGQGAHGGAAYRRHDGGHVRAPEREHGDAGEALLCCGVVVVLEGWGGLKEW